MLRGSFEGIRLNLGSVQAVAAKEMKREEVGATSEVICLREKIRQLEAEVAALTMSGGSDAIKHESAVLN